MGSYTTIQNMQWDHSSELTFDDSLSSLKISERGSQTNYRVHLEAQQTFRISVFPRPLSPQRTLTHTDATLTRAKCLIECKGVTMAQWVVLGERFPLRRGTESSEVKNWRQIHLTEYNEKQLMHLDAALEIMMPPKDLQIPRPEASQHN